MDDGLRVIPKEISKGYIIEREFKDETALDQG
jgi:hypothetical protein